MPWVNASLVLVIVVDPLCGKSEGRARSNCTADGDLVNGGKDFAGLGVVAYKVTQPMKVIGEGVSLIAE